jgi:uncharacterized membrane protein
MIGLISILILSIKEDLPLALGAFGLWTIIFKKEKRTEGTIIAIIGFAGLYIIAAILIPHYANGSSMYANRYAEFGATAKEILNTALARPDKLLTVLFSPPIKLLHIFFLFLSFLLLPFAAPKAALMALPPIMMHSLSSYKSQYSFVGQYSIPAIPFLFYSSLYGWQKLTAFVDKPKYLKGVITINKVAKASIFIVIICATIPICRYGINYLKFSPKNYFYFVKNIKPLIPTDCRLLSPNHIQPQFLNLKYSGILFSRQSMASNPDYIILANDRIPTYWQKDDYLKFSMEQKNKCQIIYEDDKLAVLKTAAPK